jgi:hypothetical protein
VKAFSTSITTPSWRPMLHGCDMEEPMIHEAGYTWKGLGNSCKQTTKRCMDCLKAKRPRSKADGLLSSRRYRCPFVSLSLSLSLSLSWDMQDLGKAARQLLRHMEKIGTCSLPCASSPRMSSSTPYLTWLPEVLPTASLASPSARWDSTPSCIWSGHRQAMARRSRTK